ncbi:hypothetical protein BDD12DRAFT_883612 [Trichophaea hybrida]|nr:hypothetical protein BDD12DRAFT_883612 [Trichophaea hybrida]
MAGAEAGEESAAEVEGEHRLVKPGRNRRRIMSTVSLNRDDRAGAEGTAGAEEGRWRIMSTVSLNRDDGAEDTVLERRSEHRLIKPGRYGAEVRRIVSTVSLNRDDMERRIRVWSGGFLSTAS